jgi:hypothetical protein
MILALGNCDCTNFVGDVLAKSPFHLQSVYALTQRVLTLPSLCPIPFPFR